MSAFILSLSLSLIQACPSYETCAFLPMNGQNPTTEEYNALFEAASQNELGASSPNLPNIETGPNRVPMTPRIACHILQPIAATESIWQQFCPDTNKTVISFDCGFGVMQVTSGAASYGPMLASDTTWNIGAGTQILINKWNGEFRGGPIGDSDPMILENWYYAVWAYNGFVFGNNPDNPQLPPNRPPFNGPNSLSRGNYPYQEIVWGYMYFPLNWRTAPKWKAIEVTYPAPGQVGMDPGPLPRLEPEHRSECKEPCEDEDCDFELVIDDRDEAFTVTETASISPSGGYEEQFHYVTGTRSEMSGAWTFTVPRTAIYRVASFNPISSLQFSNQVPLNLMARGGTLAASLDQTRPGRLFYKAGEVKLLAGQSYEVLLANSEISAQETVAFDAVRITYDRVVGDQEEGFECVAAADCVSDLVCVAGLCVQGCEVTGCPNSSCNSVTGLCDEQEVRIDAGILESGVLDAALTMMSVEVDAGPPAPNTDSECGCSTTGAQSSPSAYFGLGLLLLSFRWFRKARLRPCRRRYTS